MVPWPYNTPCQPRYTRRAPWHNYKSRGIYMITVTREPGLPDFSIISGSPGCADVQLSYLGSTIVAELKNMCDKYDAISVSQYVVMPDHVHFILHIDRNVTYHIGKAIGEFKGACSRQIGTTVFQRGFHDRILLGNMKLGTMCAYISDNPRRLLIKRMFPNLFQLRLRICLQREDYDVLGNIFLLRNPLIEQVRVSRRFTEAELLQAERVWRNVIVEGGVLVSPFISPKEKTYRDLAMNNGGNLIVIEENGFGEKYKPSGKFFDLCAQGRLLIIAPTEKRLRREDMTRAKALQLNKLAELIAAGQFEVKLRGSASPHNSLGPL